MSEKIRVVLLGGYAGDGWISIGRYQRELSRGLEALNRDSSLELIPVVPHPAAFVEQLSSAGFPGRKMASYWSRFVAYPRQIPRLAGALYHLMDQSLSYLAGSLDARRVVVTCHDLLHFPLWEGMKRRFLWPWASDRLYRFCVGRLPQCARIIAVSERNKADAVQYLGCDPNRITVIHEGISPVFLRPPDPHLLESTRARLQLPPGPVVLHVGVPTFYKNIEGLLRGLAELRRRTSRPVCLLRVGPKFSSSQRRLARQLGVAPMIREVGVHGDDILPVFNHLADCLVFPSLYEGFGFPPLEAMACGLPVVASDRGSLPEILGDAALLVNPEDPAAIAQAVQQVLEDERLRDQLRSRGWERAGRFQWERCAEQTVEVYRSVLECAKRND